MNKINYILILIFSLSVSVNAQWRKTNGPYGDDISCLTALGKNIFAGTFSNGIYISTDNGTNWESTNNGLVGTDVELLVVSGTYLIALTNSGIFISTDNGSSWKQKNTSFSPASTNCFAVSGQNIFAGTYGNGIYVL